MDHMSSLPEESYANFTHNHQFDLATLWGQLGISKKKTFRETYNEIAFLILVLIEELILRAALRF